MRVPQLPSDVHGITTSKPAAIAAARLPRIEQTRETGEPHEQQACHPDQQDLARRDEFASFYAGYIDKVPATGSRVARGPAGRHQAFEMRDTDAKGAFRYADGKWSVKEVLGHISDAERVFGYRLLRIARADTTPLAGFDENAWAASRRTTIAR